MQTSVMKERWLQALFRFYCYELLVIVGKYSNHKSRKSDQITMVLGVMPNTVQLAPSIYSRGCRPDMMRPCCAAGILYCMYCVTRISFVCSPAEVLSAELLRWNAVMPLLQVHTPQWSMFSNAYISNMCMYKHMHIKLQICFLEAKQKSCSGSWAQNDFFLILFWMFYKIHMFDLYLFFFTICNSQTVFGN